MFTKQDIENYFNAFKSQQIFLMAVGAVALIIAFLFYIRWKTAWHKGFALPLAVFAMLFLGAGFSNYKKTEPLRIRSIYNYDMHPELLKTKELPRMQELEKNINVLIDINITIIAATFFLYLYFRKKQGNEYYSGAAASLFLMGALSIAAYCIMIRSANKYSAGIGEYTASIIVR